VAWLNEDKETRNEYIDRVYGKGSAVKKPKPDDRYDLLSTVLGMAFDHASKEKGAERHADAQNFENQISARINRDHPGYALGQALKKIDETRHLTFNEKKIRELLGAINYIAIEIIELRS